MLFHDLLIPGMLVLNCRWAIAWEPDSYHLLVGMPWGLDIWILPQGWETLN